MIKSFRRFDWIWVTYLGALAWLWYPLWGSSHIPAFRDGFHFYYPQFYWLENCYQSGEYFPKWNPNEGLGTSVWGQPTWQIFYPLRVLWLIPLLSLPQLFAVWIVTHQAVAAMGMKRLAAEYQMSRRAGWLAGISFSLGCPVLFQHSNAIYLCSAAWVGWALIPMTRLMSLAAKGGESIERQSSPSKGCRLRRSALSHLMHFTGACGMMVLGGDPHTAINAMLIVTGGFAIGAFCRAKKSLRSAVQRTPVGPIQKLSGANDSLAGAWKVGVMLGGEGDGRRSLRVHYGVAVRAATCILIILLVGLQAAASWNWYRHSSRSKQPISVTDSFNSRVEAILRADNDQAQHRIFDYSLSPWSLPSCLWPTFGGFYQPVHTRWVDAIGSEGRLWVPSLYVGLLPLLMGIARWHSVVRGRSKNGKHACVEKFLFWVSLLTLLAAMGNYSLVWLLRQLLIACGLADSASYLPSDSSGSLYGFLTLAVPGYDSFRYPAKWIVWTAAGLSFAAAVHFDQWPTGRRCFRWLSLPAIGIGTTSVAIVMCCSSVLWVSPEAMSVMSQWLEKGSDQLLGQAKAPQVLKEVLFALHWPLVILSLVGIGIIALPKRIQLATVLIISLADLSMCARHWITTTPEPQTMNSPKVGGSLQSLWANVRQADIGDLRLMDGENDQATQIRLQQAFLMAKLGHLSGVSTFHAAGPLRPQAVVKIENWLSRHDNLCVDQPGLDEVLSYLGINRRLIRESGDYQWIELELQSGRSLCEIIPSRPGPASAEKSVHADQFVSWNWTSNSALTIRVTAIRDCTLLVRQLNDRGWNVHCTTISQLKPTDGELFVALPLTAGTHLIQLWRKALY